MADQSMRRADDLLTELTRPDPDARYRDLGVGFYDTRITDDPKKRNHIRQFEALGYRVTLDPAA